MRDQTYGRFGPHRAASTGTNRDASSETKTTPRRPLASTEYRRTFVSQNDPKYGTPALPAMPMSRMRNGTRPT